MPFASSEERKAYHKTHYQKYKEHYKKKAKQRNKAARERKRAILHVAKSRPCSDCGNTYPPCVMDFDHINKATKKFDVGRGAGNSGVTEKIFLEEIAKCDLVCANCHRIRTHMTGRGSLAEPVVWDHVQGGSIPPVPIKERRYE